MSNAGAWHDRPCYVISPRHGHHLPGPEQNEEGKVNNLSLKWKILLSVTLTCILAVIVTTAVTARSGLATTEETILEDTRTLAKVLGEASIGAITFNDSGTVEDRKSTRLNSSHVAISYAV